MSQQQTIPHRDATHHIRGDLPDPSLLAETADVPLSGLRIKVTGDGSPTLSDGTSFARPAGAPLEIVSGGEAMHHLGGAVSETLHVYGPAIREAWEFATGQLAEGAHQRPVHFGIVGLGLGYLERLCLAAAEERSSHRIPCTIESFEANEALVRRFTQWLHGVPDPWHDWVDRAVTTALPEQVPEHRRCRLRSMLDAGSLRLSGALGAHVLDWDRDTSRRFHAVLYDPYSAGTAPELWDPDFLAPFLHRWANPDFCVFATYASRSSLRNALRRCGFAVTIRQGFARKRECTMAIRK